MQLSKNFSKKELECKCGCGMIPTPEAIEALQRLRNKFGYPILITSAARCKTHNEKVGGSKNSYHTKGLAFDIKRPNSRLTGSLLNLAFEEGFKGLGWAKTFIHIDLREDFTAWDY